LCHAFEPPIPASSDRSLSRDSYRVVKMDYAIWLSGSKWDSDTVVEKNTLTNDGIGIILEDGAASTIQNNRIKNFWWLDIYY